MGLANNGGITSGTVNPAAIHLSGTLAARVAASSVSAGTLYTATDDNGGTTYRSDGISTWTKIADMESKLADARAEALRLAGGWRELTALRTHVTDGDIHTPMSYAITITDEDHTLESPTDS